MKIWKTIRKAMIDADISSIMELSEATGIPYSTLTHERKDSPQTFRGYELGAIIKATNMKTEYMVEIMNGFKGG